MATISFSKQNPAATMQRQLLSEGSYYGLVWQQPVVFIQIHK